MNNAERVSRLEALIAQMQSERESLTKVVASQTGLSFNLSKEGQIDNSGVINPNEQLLRENQAQLEETEKLAMENRESMLDEEVKAIINSNQSYAPDPCSSMLPEPQLLFLGTSSMKPTQHRGASAIYLFNKSAGLLMDVAEGTYG